MGKSHRHKRHADGKFHIDGKKFDDLEGSRAQVWHGTVYKTSGGLKKRDLVKNKHGRIVSKRKQATARREKRLVKAGYKPTKGKFIVMRKSMRHKHTSKRRKSMHKRRKGGG